MGKLRWEVGLDGMVARKFQGNQSNARRAVVARGCTGDRLSRVGGVNCGELSFRPWSASLVTSDRFNLVGDGEDDGHVNT